MGIQPIDLQTLYAQLDKVGKSQVQQQAAAQNTREAELVKNRQEAEKKVSTVQEAEAGEERAGVVRERKESSGNNDAGSQSRQDTPSANGEQNEPDDREVIRDPDLGSHIDISG